MTTPVVEIRPIHEFPKWRTPPISIISDSSVNQRAPSGPAVILLTERWGFGMGYVVTVPDVVIRPIALPSVNQRAPSGPAAIPVG